MAYRRVPFAPHEYYHCYTRGIDKRITFQDTADYERFLQALYVCNDTEPYHRGSLSDISHAQILKLTRGEPLVALVAFCLMPNHYHLVLRELVENGTARFMQKVGTMYTMYFNAKNDRIGGLFVRPFRSKHLHDDAYLKRVIPYLHLNPAEIVEPEWKEGKVRNISELKTSLESYRFSSLPEYSGSIRPERSIVDITLVCDLHDTIPNLEAVITEASAYYKSLRW